MGLGRRDELAQQQGDQDDGDQTGGDERTATAS